jgi:uncharacterized protein
MPRRLRLFPLNAVLFPGAALNLHIFEARYKQMISECLETGEGFGVALIADGAEAGDPNVTPHDIGSIAEIIDVQPLPFGRFYVSTVGRERFRITEIVSREPYLTVEAELLADDAPVDDEDIDVLSARVRELFAEYLELLLEFSGQETIADVPDDAQDASYVIGDTLQIAEAFKQRLLELDTAEERLVAERDFLEGLLPRLRRLLERRRQEREASADRGEELAVRSHQEKFFGKHFSLN